MKLKTQTNGLAFLNDLVWLNILYELTDLNLCTLEKIIFHN
jgi:hypothetical protein